MHGNRRGGAMRPCLGCPQRDENENSRLRICPEPAVSLRLRVCCSTMMAQDITAHTGCTYRKEYAMEHRMVGESEMIPCPTPKTYRVEDIARILGIGRSSAYNLVKAGHFRTIRIGSSIRISRKSFDEWLEQKEA